MMGKYVLDGRTPRPAALSEWAAQCEGARDERHPWRVAETNGDGWRVSTVFLGIDHRFTSDGPPVLFETMIFDGPHAGYQERCCTWEQAEEQHGMAVALAEKGTSRP